MIGESIYFKMQGMQRKRRGVIVGGSHVDGWQVQGRRQADQFQAPVFIVPAGQLQTVAEHKAERQKSGIFETTSTKGRRITAEEMKRRAEAAARALQFTELYVMQSRAMIEVRRRIVRKLAASNGIAATIDDFEFEELTSEFQFASLLAFRTAASKATAEQIDEFRSHLMGKIDSSRIMGTIARTGKTAAIRYLKARQEYHRLHVDISGKERRLAA